MKIIKKMVAFLMLFSVIQVSAQSLYQRGYLGRYENGIGVDVLKAKDNAVIVVELYSRSYHCSKVYTGTEYFYLLRKIDSVGKTIWTSNVVYQKPLFFNSISENEFDVICGHLLCPPSPRISFCKMDTLGTVSINKTVRVQSLLDPEMMLNGAFTNKGGYVLYGYDYLSSHSSKIVLINKTGDTLSSQTFNKFDLKGVEPSSDGGYIAIGDSSSNNGKGLIFKINSVGEIVWKREKTKNTNFKSLIAGLNDSYLVQIDSTVLHINSNGDTLFNKKPSMMLEAIHQVSDTLFVGLSTSSEYRSLVFFNAEFSVTRNIPFEKVGQWGVLKVIDSSIYVTATQIGDNSDTSHLIIIKTDFNGSKVSYLSSNLATEKADITIYPNPTNNTLGINASKIVAKYFIYSANGKLIAEAEGISADVFSIDVNSLQRGCFTIKLQFFDHTEYLHTFVKE